MLVQIFEFAFHRQPTDVVVSSHRPDPGVPGLTDTFDFLDEPRAGDLQGACTFAKLRVVVIRNVEGVPQ